MYLNIIKKDLKRQKTMNVILIIFIILSTMFVASGMNNIITVFTGLDNFIDKADCGDYVIASQQLEDDYSLQEKLEKLDSVTNVKSEKYIEIPIDNFIIDGADLTNANSSYILLMSDNEMAINFFDMDNKKITSVNEGEVYITGSFMKDFDLSDGDTFIIDMKGVRKELRIKSHAKDAVLGSNIIGNKRLIMNEKDFRAFADVPEITENHCGKITYIETDDTEAIERLLGDEQGIDFSGERSLIKTTYLLDMIIVAVLFVVSIFLMIIAFVMLRFTINFTLSGEIREIGVMKAIGIGNAKIRFLYMVKYFTMAVTGALIGLILSIPFAKMLLDSVSYNMVLDNDNKILINVLSSFAVIAVILLFCWRCTGKVKKYSPVDSIRNGQTGERFRKKGILSLKKTRLGTTGFLASNDVLSSPKKFGIITVTMTILLVLVMTLANIVNTLRGDTIIQTFGTQKTDVYIDFYSDEEMYKKTGGDVNREKKFAEIEEKLAENGMPGKCSMEALFHYSLAYGDKKISLNVYQGQNTDIEGYDMLEGDVPRNADEIVLTEYVSDYLDAHIGDKVTINMNGEDKEFIVTGYFQCMNNLGKNARLNNVIKLDYCDFLGGMGYQIEFDDHPSDKVIAERIDKMKDIFGTQYKYQTAGEFVDECTRSSDTISTVKNLILLIGLVICILIVVLMERSMVEKDKCEIALIKSLGFRNGNIMKWHTFRMMITAVVASILAIIVSVPVTKAFGNSIFGMLGAGKNLRYVIKPAEVFGLYPVIFMTVIALATVLAAISAAKIKASDTSAVE
ncbi:MAG: FtsX-like permease family protein [Ruminococcus sp.]|nr:FtsX-like permease family protein [Ruminococcus sp.]